ncbi:hypothetical protein ACFQ60_23220 [Streptomyces zhihengii]
MTHGADIDTDGPEPGGRTPVIDAGAELDPVHPRNPPPSRRGQGGDGAHLGRGRRAGLPGEVNDVPVRSSRSAVDIVRANVFTRFNAIIGVLWVIMLFVAPIQDSLFGFVIVANTGIGIIQELRAKKTLDSLAVIGEAKPRCAGTAPPPPSPPPRSSSGISSNSAPATRSWSTARSRRRTAWRSTSRC